MQLQFFFVKMISLWLFFLKMKQEWIIFPVRVYHLTSFFLIQEKWFFQIIFGQTRPNFEYKFGLANVWAVDGINRFRCHPKTIFSGAKRHSRNSILLGAIIPLCVLCIVLVHWLFYLSVMKWGENKNKWANIYTAVSILAIYYVLIKIDYSPLTYNNIMCSCGNESENWAFIFFVFSCSHTLNVEHFKFISSRNERSELMW